MSASLIIHKLENGINTKSLSIIFGQNASEECICGEWSESKIDIKKKNADRSRLIVKQVTDHDVSDFNIDMCAKQINGPNTSDNNISNLFMSSENDANIESNPQKLPYRGNNLETDQRDINLLEHSLGKVKENNARIMDNIQKLNRTLTYTMKKEIFDIICPKPMRSFPCDVCGKCFVYETGLKRHYSLVHASIDKQQRWQVIWTCIECFQVWPHKELAIKHSNYCCTAENVDCIKEIKTSRLLQCEFCEKVYTSIPRLLKHSRTHTTDKNYECNACQLFFESYKTAEQHWVTCPWLLMCYKFSLPKMLLCNACDRKFRNYDHLYNHRYKMSHFLLKSPKNEESNVNGPVKLVYQCETCASCLSTIPNLQAHRNQYHPSFNQLMLYMNPSEDQEVQ